MNKFPFLTSIIWLPIILGLLILVLQLVIKKNQELKLKISKYIALVGSLSTVLISLFLYKMFVNQQTAMQFIEFKSWMPNLNVNYYLGIDGISLSLLILTVVMNMLVIISGLSSIKSKLAEYLAAMLIMQGLMSGVFVAIDAVLFYIFFESMLIPMFLIIGIWGGENRIYATIKFFLYTFLGSVFLLIAIIYMQVKMGSFRIHDFYMLPLSMVEQKWLFFAFLLAFAIKIPMWPVHTWLPDAHVEAPTGASVILAAITLKIGGYGLIRFLLPIVPDAAYHFSNYIIVFSLVSIIYIALVAIVQQDLKKLIAYSSISHMGFVTLGMFLVFYTKNSMGIEGAMVQMISHGLISAALFLSVGVLYDRMHTKQISEFGGVVNTMPIFATFFMLFAFANIGVPGTSGFVGEFLIIMAAFKAKMYYAVLAALTLILGAVYTLWMYKRVIFGQAVKATVLSLKDLTRTEKNVFIFLSIIILWLGIFPNALLDLLHTASVDLTLQALSSKL